MDEGDAPFPLPDVAAPTEDEDQAYLRALLVEPEVRIFLGDSGQLVIARGK